MPGQGRRMGTGTDLWYSSFFEEGLFRDWVRRDLSWIGSGGTFPGLGSEGLFRVWARRDFSGFGSKMALLKLKCQKKEAKKRFVLALTVKKTFKQPKLKLNINITAE